MAAAEGCVETPACRVSGKHEVWEGAGSSAARGDDLAIRWTTAPSAPDLESRQMAQYLALAPERSVDYAIGGVSDECKELALVAGLNVADAASVADADGDDLAVPLNCDGVRQLVATAGPITSVSAEVRLYLTAASETRIELALGAVAASANL